jgi:hypothetical protein
VNILVVSGKGGLCSVAGPEFLELKHATLQWVKKIEKGDVGSEAT